MGAGNRLTFLHLLAWEENTMTDSANTYDSMAEAYARRSETGPYNALYERPALLACLPDDLQGQTVLDVGCGAGSLTRHLLTRGATSSGFDISGGLIAIAQRNFGEQATFRVADLAQPLDFVPTASQDWIVASLVMHYLADWVAPLRELRRVVRPDGRFVFSTHHPFMDWRWFELDDYFSQQLAVDTWTVEEHTVEVRVYHRSLTAMSAAFAASGWAIEHMVEPQPIAAMQESHPDHYRKLMTTPHFLIFTLKPLG